MRRDEGLEGMWPVVVVISREEGGRWRSAILEVSLLLIEIFYV